MWTGHSCEVQPCTQEAKVPVGLREREEQTWQGLGQAGGQSLGAESAPILPGTLCRKTSHKELAQIVHPET